MVLPDINILIYAYTETMPDHKAYRAWLTERVTSDEAFGMSELVLSGFLRIVTNPRSFKPPSTFEQAFKFVDQIRSRPNCIIVNPSPRHWGIFERLCRETNATGKLIPDAYFAALAIDHGCEWITADRDFGRFAGLKWRNPVKN